MLRTDPDTDTFLSVRGLLLGIANKIAGGVADPEDVVQDAWLRWNRTDREAVRDATAFLCRITSRLALSTVRSAHVRHRSPHELPMDQPDRDADPALAVESMERLREAAYLMVRRLTPREQAAYVLRESFGYPYPDIGELVGCTEANARQMIRRARLRLRGKPNRSPSADEQRRLLAAFVAATRPGREGRSGFVDAVVLTGIADAWTAETTFTTQGDSHLNASANQKAADGSGPAGPSTGDSGSTRSGRE